MNTLYNEIYALYQSKTARLKKQVTHWMGKFMIVKAENNRIRSINRKTTNINADLCIELTRMQAELTARLGAKDDTIKSLRRLVGELESVIRDTVPV
jgi:hypothetical protein